MNGAVFVFQGASDLASSIFFRNVLIEAYY